MATARRKLFLFDVDGTILDDTKHIVPKTSEQIARLSKKGHVCAIASGRTPLGSIRIAINAGIGDYIVANNGAVLFDLQTDTFKTTGVLDQRVVDYFVQTAQKWRRELSWAIGIKSYEVYFGTKPQTDIDDRAFYIGGILVEDYSDWELVKHTLDGSRPISKITFKAERAVIEPVLAACIKDLGPLATIVGGANVYIDCTPPGVSKYTGAVAIQKLLGIANEDTYAFGDSMNDYEMVLKVGHGIAMGNAQPELKKAARTVIGDNNSTAIGDFLAAVDTDQ